MEGASVTKALSWLVFQREQRLSAFRSMGKDVGRYSQKVWQHTFDECEVHALVWHERKNKKNQLFLKWQRQSMQDMMRLSARIICPHLHRKGCYERVVVDKLMTIQWCKNHRNWSTEMWKTIWWSDESSFTIFSSLAKWMCDVHQKNSTSLKPGLCYAVGDIFPARAHQIVWLVWK